MALPNYSILYSAPTSGTGGAGSPADVLIKDATSGLYVKATTANRGTRRSTGIALHAYAAGSSVDIHQFGELDAVTANLGAGSASWVRVSATGTLERASVSGSDDVVGYVEADGTFKACFGFLTAAMTTGGGGGGGATLPIDLADPGSVTGVLDPTNGGTGASSLPAGGLAGLTAMAAGDALAESSAITAAASASATAITTERSTVRTLTNVTLTAPVATTPRVQTRLDIDNPANTFQYQITPAAIAANRILNLPLLTATDTVAVLALAQTFTNKSLVLASNTITDASQALGDIAYCNGTRFVRFARGATAGQSLTATATTIAYSSNPGVAAQAIAALAIDWSAGQVFTKTLSAGGNTFTFSNAASGMTIMVRLTGAASTVTWPTVRWAGGVAPTQTASGTDVYTFVHDGTNIYGSVVQAMA